jgi:hypothetical protein
MNLEQSRVYCIAGKRSLGRGSRAFPTKGRVDLRKIYNIHQEVKMAKLKYIEGFCNRNVAIPISVVLVQMNMSKRMWLN